MEQNIKVITQFEQGSLHQKYKYGPTGQKPINFITELNSSGKPIILKDCIWISYYTVANL